MKNLVVEIMQNRTIKVSDPAPEVAGNVFSICGLNEPARDYETSWYSEKNHDLAAHVYISTMLKDKIDEILEQFDKIAEKCLSNDDLKLLEGMKV